MKKTVKSVLIGITILSYIWESILIFTYACSADSSIFYSLSLVLYIALLLAPFMVVGVKNPKAIYFFDNIFPVLSIDAACVIAFLCTNEIGNYYMNFPVLINNSTSTPDQLEAVNIWMCQAILITHCISICIMALSMVDANKKMILKSSISLEKLMLKLPR